VRVLVTGGAGYIGSVTTRLLIARGHDVSVLDTLERGHRAAVPDEADLTVGSVGDRGAVMHAMEGCDAVLHLAGYIDVAESQRVPQSYFDNNSEAPLTMLDAMSEKGLRSIVFSSTAAVYGEPVQVPIREDSPTVPVNAYGASKLAFEKTLEAREHEVGLRSVRFRYFNVAGAATDGTAGEAHSPETHIIPRILTAMRDGNRSFEVYGDDYPTRDGTCVRDYIHVADLATAHLRGLVHVVEGGDGGVLNLGNGAGFTNLEVLNACGRVTGIPIDVTVGPRRDGDPAVLVASAERAAEVLGWTPERSDLDTMVADAWAWHVANPRGYE